MLFFGFYFPPLSFLCVMYLYCTFMYMYMYMDGWGIKAGA